MNKHQEVLDYLEGGNLFGELSNESLEEMENIIAKETPMKPYYPPQWPTPDCPVCKANIGDSPRCRECGQKIDWSDDNE